MANTSGSFGWSESYYQAGISFNSAFTNAGALATARLTILADDMQIDYVRLSQEGVPRDSTTVQSTPVIGGLTVGMRAPMSPWDALLVELTSTDRLTRGHKFLHGGFQDWFNADESYKVMNTDHTAIEAFGDLIKAAPFVLRAGPKTARLYKTILGIAYERKTTHHVGRPFGGLHGKRSRV
jgi:hypothetical protein